MEDWSFSTLRSVYIQNTPYDYPLGSYYTKSGQNHTIRGGGAPVGLVPALNTGWQVIPNILFGHFLAPKDWYSLQIKYQAISVTSCSCQLFNMIPIQNTLAIQGNTTFSAFNNTIYAWGYSDDFYETPPFNWAQSNNNCFIVDNLALNPVFKEGRYIASSSYNFWYDLSSAKIDSDAKPTSTGTIADFPFVRPWGANPIYYQRAFTKGTTTWNRQFLPTYFWLFPLNWNQAKGVVGARDYNASDLTGVFWDPLNRPEKLMELRPGKNAISYHWNLDPVDSGKMYNMDALALLWPYNKEGRNQTNWGFEKQTFHADVVHPREVNNTQRLGDPTDNNTSDGDGVAPFYGTSADSLFDWRNIPIVPTNWWYKEIGETNPWKYAILTLTSGQNTSDVNAVEKWSGLPFFNLSFPGTEREQVLYPPTQWFTKTVPLFDAQNNLIQVEAQVFMKLTLSGKGKKRDSALFCPTFGPLDGTNLYSASRNTYFEQSVIRGRSGGMRRTQASFEDMPFWGDRMARYKVGLNVDYTLDKVEGNIPFTSISEIPVAAGTSTLTDSVPYKRQRLDY